MKPLAVVNARVVTPPPPPAHGPMARRAGAMSDLVVIPGCTVLIRGTVIESAGPGVTIPPDADVVDAGNRVVVPGFIDCHTHACYAGSRHDEWAERLRGTPYLDILARGGGIMSTVSATRDASVETLTTLLTSRLQRMLTHGTTTAEVKSGYGLDGDSELRMLDAINRSAGACPITVVPTALLGHAIDPSILDFVDCTVTETLDRVHRAYPGLAIDAYCEHGAWSVSQCESLLGRAQSLGHPIRLHTDQFNSLGGVPLAIRLGALSADHLEASTADDLRRLAQSETIGVALPLCAIHAPGAGVHKSADIRALIDMGGAAAIATNFNPGSAPCLSVPMAIGAAVRLCGMTWQEALCAATVNAAAVLNLRDRGAIAPGMRADLAILCHDDERDLAFEFGGNPVLQVIVRGRVWP